MSATNLDVSSNAESKSKGRGCSGNRAASSINVGIRYGVRSARGFPIGSAILSMMLLATCEIAMAAATSASGAAPAPGSMSAGTSTAGGGNILPSIAVNAAARAKLPANIRDRNEILVGIVNDYPPFNFVEPGQATVGGVSVDMANAIGKALGINIKYQVTTVSAMIPSLQSGRIDMMITGTYDTPKRQEILDLIDYITDGEAIAVARGNPKHLDKDNLCGATIGYVAGTLYGEKELPERSATCVKNGRPEIKVSVFPGAGETATALRSGRIDGYIQGAVYSGYLVSKTGGEIEVAGSAYSQIPVAMLLAKNSPLTQGIQAGLQGLMDSGAYKKILDKWGLANFARPCASINTDESRCVSVR